MRQVRQVAEVSYGIEVWRSDPKRPLSPILFLDELTPRRQRPIGAAMNASNASPHTSRYAAHDSGSAWFATP
jgi:hypothetical protein